MLLRVAHSPDADDAFMFHALANHKIDTGDREYQHTCGTSKPSTAGPWKAGTRSPR